MPGHHTIDCQWDVDSASEPGILRVTLRGRMSVAEMRAFVAAHNAAIDAYAGADYKVLCDIRTLATLSPECSDLFEQAKRHSDSQKGFRGSAVWSENNPIVAMQHVRTSKTSGVFNSELISSDETALRAHLETVWRK